MMLTVIRSSAPGNTAAEGLWFVLARIVQAICLGNSVAFPARSDADAIGLPRPSPKLVQQHQIFVDGTPRLDDGSVFQGRPEDPSAGVAVPGVVMVTSLGGHGAAAVDEVDDQAGRCRCQLDDRGVGEVGPIGAVGVLAAALREALDVESEKAAIVGNVVAEPRVDRVRIVRVRDGDGILRGRGPCCRRKPRGLRVVFERRRRKRRKGAGGGEIFVHRTRCESIALVFGR
mmetsp:Transcript_11928/g.28291  ORF Transcript_11928/g.28291 Transcript_11928/m.28291 type:complete len:230 (+) Transcript_11928:1909-2598(+)